MSHTTTQLNWHLKYKEVYEELHDYKVENKRLQAAVLTLRSDNILLSEKLSAVRTSLSEITQLLTKEMK
jgi:hypothetical protein